MQLWMRQRGCEDRGYRLRLLSKTVALPVAARFLSEPGSAVAAAQNQLSTLAFLRSDFVKRTFPVDVEPRCVHNAAV